jgi:hypothetical protein
MLVGDLWVSRDTTTIQGRGRTRIMFRSPQVHDHVHGFWCRTGPASWRFLDQPQWRGLGQCKCFWKNATVWPQASQAAMRW